MSRSPDITRYPDSNRSPDSTRSPDFNMRPKFDLRANCEPNQVLLRIKERLEQNDSIVTGKVFPSSAVLKMVPERGHLWSPQLQVSVEPILPKGSVVHVLIGPKPSVWSLFIAGYCFFGFIGIMGAIFGYSQLTLSQPATAFWTAPFALIGCLSTYLLARLGRKLAHDQSVLLSEAVDQSLLKCNDRA